MATRNQSWFEQLEVMHFLSGVWTQKGGSLVSEAQSGPVSNAVKCSYLKSLNSLTKKFLQVRKKNGLCKYTNSNIKL